MDYSQPQQSTQEKKSLTDHIGSAWSGFKGMFSDNTPPASPTKAIGGRRRHRKSMKGGKSRKIVKSLCKGKKIHSPNKCKKIRGCKVASGKKRSFCRKSKNHTKKTKH